MNKVVLTGNLTRKPELASTPNGVSVCKFAIAVARDYAGADGKKETDFFNIVTWRGLADNCSKFLDKGNKVCVVGSLQNRSYEDKEGAIRTVTEIIANDVEFLTPKNNSTKDEEQIITTPKDRPKLESIDDNLLPF